MSTLTNRVGAKPHAGELSYFSYIWKCGLGSEVAYFLCLFGAFIPGRNTSGTELHQMIFETLPGFVWLTPTSVVLGALYMLVFSITFGAFMVWMHNSSIKE